MLTLPGWQRLRDLALVLALLATTSYCTGADDAEPAMRTVSAAPGEVAETDTRTAITVEPATRLAVLAEMRIMLRAVQGIVGGAANGDTAAIRAAALSAGMRAASESEPAVQQQLGPEFVQLGMRTHMAFDSLAAAISATNRDAVLRRLATVMGNCVGCHEQWRLTTQP